MERLEWYSAIAALQRALCVKSMQRIPTNESHMRNSLQNRFDMRHFKSRSPRLKESTARTFSGNYRKLISDGTPVATSVIGIPSSKRWRKLLIGDLDKELMNFIYDLREVRSVFNANIAIAAAKGIEIILAGRERRPCNHRQKLSEIFV